MKSLAGATLLALSVLPAPTPAAAGAAPQQIVNAVCTCKPHFAARPPEANYEIEFDITIAAGTNCSNGQWVWDPVKMEWFLVNGCEELQGDGCSFTGIITVTHTTDLFYGYSENVDEDIDCDNLEIFELRDGSNTLLGVYGFSCNACDASL